MKFVAVASVLLASAMSAPLEERNVNNYGNNGGYPANSCGNGNYGGVYRRNNDFGNKGYGGFGKGGGFGYGGYPSNKWSPRNGHPFNWRNGGN